MINTSRLLKTGLAVITIAALLAGCGANKGQQKMAVSVNTYKVAAEDTPVTAEYSGMVIATDKVPVQAKISGRVLEKYIKGGDIVSAGQPLFRLDSRQYDAALAQAKATQAQAAANLANQQMNLRRYQTLADQDAISQQTVTDQEAATNQENAVLEANAAQVQSAQDNVDDTIVYAPFSGKLNVDDVPVGTFATAGSTALVTISTQDPVYVEFSISEAEYLQMVKKSADNPGSWGNHLKLRLSDGTIYAEEGHVVQINHGIQNNSGAITVKAVFANPYNMLIPGLYATVISDTQVQQKAILVPQRAVQQTLGKYFVAVLNENGEMQNKEVQPGQQVGKFWIINSGLQDGDTIIVDGYQKANTAGQLDQHLLTKDDIEKGDAKVSQS
ncbi:MAG: efflux RND transporter periplasmic adaptor subunit [Megasphaera sp.]|jgi:membrane fusion protein (multidrug efflux system)|nr:efflux RND transporter periplasmic adaptor subunit [Megasphaera sp.]MCI1822853.1 efflux RND transporter periplasmic adaptor subunit [Megasphaera sp.]